MVASTNNSWCTNRPEKKSIRNLVMDFYKNKHPEVAKVAIFLPGDSFECVELAFQKKIINEDTFMMFVEHDKSEEGKLKIEKQKKYLEKKFKKGYHHHGEIYNLNLRNIVEKCGKKIDIAFLDYCGSMTANIAAWNKEYADCFASNSVIASTFTLGHWSTKFLKEIVAEEDYYKNLFQNIDQFIGNGYYYPKQDNKTGDYIHEGYIPIILSNIFSWRGKFYIDKVEEYGDTSPMMCIFAHKQEDRQSPMPLIISNLKLNLNESKYIIPKDDSPKNKPIMSKEKKSVQSPYYRIICMFQKAQTSYDVAGAKAATTKLKNKMMAERGLSNDKASAIIRTQLTMNKIKHDWK